MYRAYSTQKPHHHNHSHGSQGYYGGGQQQQPGYGGGNAAGYGGGPSGGYAGGGPGGFRNTGPPPGADPQLWQWFRAVDTDGSGGITATELQSALVNGNWTNFDLDTVKMLMNIFDTNRSGTINFEEFAGLWKYISDWQGVFRHFDRDGSGTIDGNELANAFANFGYNLTPDTLEQIQQKYAIAPTAYGEQPAGITFDRFVRACVAVKSLTESFERLDTDRDGWVRINYNQYLQVALSAP